MHQIYFLLLIFMIKEEYKYSALTSKIIGCAIEVHTIIGNGFQEVVYQRALEEEFLLQNVPFLREQEISILYKNKLIGTRRVDFLVNQVICVELKSVIQLEAVHLAQAINYLEAYHLEVGLLINFGARKLEFKRVVNTKYDKK